MQLALPMRLLRERDVGLLGGGKNAHILSHAIKQTRDLIVAGIYLAATI